MNFMRNVFIILPCYNEEEAINSFWIELKQQCQRITNALNVKMNLVWVDDGSSDATWAKIRALEATEGLGFNGLRFVKNFGHQSALQAGCEFVSKHSDFSAQSIVTLMDSDGQHPVELLEGLISKLLAGARHIQMVRSDDQSVSFFKKITSQFFYRSFRFLTQIEMPEGASDFRGFSGDVLLNYLKFTESGRFNRGLFYLAETPLFLPYQAKVRSHGSSKYSLSKMLRLAFIGITNFSNRPLIFASLFSALFGFLVCLGYLSFELFRLSQGRVFQPGWFTVMAVVSLWGMILSFCMFLLSIYLGRVFDEVKKRPVYLVRDQF